MVQTIRVQNDLQKKPNRLLRIFEVSEIVSEPLKDNRRTEWDARNNAKAHQNIQDDVPRLQEGHANDSTDTPLKQHCVKNDLGPAECAERLNNIFGCTENSGFLTCLIGFDHYWHTGDQLTRKDRR